MDSQKHLISISSGTVFKAVLIVLFVWFLFVIKDIVLVVLTAVVLASSIEPLIAWFKKNKIKRLLAVIITYVILGVFATFLLYLFVPYFIKDTSNFLGAVPKYIDTISLWNPLNQDLSTEKTTAVAISEGITEGTRAVKNITSNSGIKNVFDDLSNAFSNVSEGVFRILSVVFGGIFSFILIIVLSFYLAVQENGIGNFLKVIVPDKHERYVLDLWSRTELKIGYWLQGQLLLGLLVGVLVYLALIVWGVENALFLAVIAAVFEIIPLFGPILASIPAIAVGYSDAGMTQALFIAGSYLVIHQFENHLFYPLVVKKIIGVPPIIVILALIIGAKLAGFLGLLLSVPVATILMEYFNDLQKSKLAKN